MSNRPRPKPDWLDATTTRQPAWFRRATASSAPGWGAQSSGVRTKSSGICPSDPSRSSTMSLTVPPIQTLLDVKAAAPGGPKHGRGHWGSSEPHIGGS